MTEETKQSSEVKEPDLAQEALDATDATAQTKEGEASPAGESEQPQGVPVAKHAALRQRAQQAEVAQARAEGELDAVKRQQATAAPSAKSPLDLEIERQAALGATEENMAVSPSVIKANDLYNQQVANQARADAVRQELATKQTTSANKAKAAIEDWQEVILAGDALLSPGEAVDIAACGDNFGQVAYDKCKAAIERNAPKSESKTETAPEKKEGKPEAEEKVPTQAEILKDLNVDAVTEAAAQL